MKKALAIVFTKRFFIIFGILNLLLALANYLFEIEAVIGLLELFIWGNLGIVFLYAFIIGIINMFNE